MMAVQRVQVPVSFQYENAQGDLIPIPGGTAVTITDRNTLQPAIVYAGLTGSATISNLTTDSGGNVPGYVVEGSYLITAAANTGATPPFSGASINYEAVRGDGVENIFPGAVTSAALANGAVNLTALATAVAQALVPTGSILDYAGSAAPAGWHLCNGAVVAQVGTYAALYGVIGSTYNTGGEGSGNFRLPNTQQRFCLGLASSGTGDVLGSTGGAIGHTHSVPRLAIPALSIPSLLVNSHTHPLSSNGGAAIGFTNQAPGLYRGPVLGIYVNQTGPAEFFSGAWVTAAGDWAGAPNGNATDSYDIRFAQTINTHALTGETDSAQASTVANTTVQGLTDGGTTGQADPPWIAVNKIIKL